MRLLRLAVKGGLLAAHFGLGLAAAALGLARGAGFKRWWSHAACAILGLRVRSVGAPAQGPVLYVANHVSYLEVVALSAVIPVCFVAKDDVARWPVIGRLAAAAGTLFLRRGSARAAARTADAVARRLAAGEGVIVFPEGTSTDGAQVLPFKPSLFEAPARQGRDVQPVSVFYDPPRDGGPSVAPYIGDDVFLPHLLRVLAEPEIALELTFGAVIRGRERGELAAASWAAVTEGLEACAQRRSGERSLPAPQRVRIAGRALAAPLASSTA